MVHANKSGAPLCKPNSVWTVPATRLCADSLPRRIVLNDRQRREQIDEQQLSEVFEPRREVLRQGLLVPRFADSVHKCGNSSASASDGILTLSWDAVSGVWRGGSTVGMHSSWAGLGGQHPNERVIQQV